MEEQDSKSTTPNKGISTIPQSDVDPLASWSEASKTPPSPSSPIPELPPPLPTSAAQPSQVNEGENLRKRKFSERKPPKTSQVWDHFVKISLEETNGEIRAYCKYCNNTYACDPNKHGTASLKRHLLKCPKNPNKADNCKQQPMLQCLSSASQGRVLVSHVYNEKQNLTILQYLLELAEQLRQFDNFDKSDASCVIDVGAAASGIVAAAGGAGAIGGAGTFMKDID